MNKLWMWLTDLLLKFSTKKETPKMDETSTPAAVPTVAEVPWPMFPKVIDLAACKARYGEVGEGVWKDEGKWCVMLEIPVEVAAKMINIATGKPTLHIYVNRDMAAPLLQAFKFVVERGFLGELETFDGCLMIRDVRGEPGKPSCHSYALAIDLDAKTNKLGAVPTFSAGFVSCFVDVGFDWGGEFHRQDGMHFSWAWEHTEPRVLKA